VLSFHCICSSPYIAACFLLDAGLVGFPFTSFCSH
jgi:hypothetical protein